MWVEAMLPRVDSALINLRENLKIKFSDSSLTFLPASNVHPPNYFVDDRLLCPQTDLQHSQISIQLSPAQHSYLNCVCLDSLTGAQLVWNNASASCLVPQFNPAGIVFDSVVNTSSPRLSVRRGFYPSLFTTSQSKTFWDLSQLEVHECQTAEACNPQFDETSPLYDASFTCAEGYEGFLCSHCRSGYYSVQGHCLSCFAGSEVLVPIFSVVGAIILLAGLWISSGNIRAASLTIAFFFLQLLEALPSNRTADGAASLFLSFLYFRPFAWECVDNTLNASSRLFFYLGLVLSLPFVAALIGSAVYLYGARGLSGAQMYSWRQSCKTRALEFGWMLAQLMYLPVAQSTLSTFNCRTDNGPPYVLAAPYLLCHRDDMVLASALLLSVFVIPFPLVSLWRHHRALHRDDKHLLGSLRDPAKHWWWIPVVLDGRRLVIAMLVALLPWQSAWLAPPVFLVLLSMLIAVLVLRPYYLNWENNLETCSLAAASIIYSAILQGDRSYSLATLVSAVSIICKIVAFAVILLTFFSKVRLCRRVYERVRSTQSLSTEPSSLVVASSVPDVEMETNPAFSGETTMEVN